MIVSRIFPLLFLATGSVAADMTDPTHFSSVGWVLVSLTSLVMILKLGMDTWKAHFREQPRPAGTYQTISACAEHKRDVTDQIGSVQSAAIESDKRLESDMHELGQIIRKVETDLKIEGSRRAASIHSRVDELNGTVQRLDERTATTNATLSEHGRKIDLILTRLK